MNNQSGVPRILIALLLAGIIGIGLIGAGGFFFYKNVVQKRAKNQQAMKELTAVSDQINQEMRDKIGKEDTVDGAAAKAKEIEDAMGRAASKASGDEAKGMRAAQHIMGAMQTFVANYEKAYSAFGSKGGVEPGSFKSDADFDERLALLKTFSSANDDFMGFLKGVDGRFRAELAKENVGVKTADEMTKGFYKGGNIDKLVAIRATDQDLCATMDKYLQLLKREWGNWETKEGTVVFKRAGVIEEFNGYATHIQEVANRQMELQQQVLKAQQQQQQRRAGAAVAR